MVSLLFDDLNGGGHLSRPVMILHHSWPVFSIVSNLLTSPLPTKHTRRSLIGNKISFHQKLKNLAEQVIPPLHPFLPHDWKIIKQIKSSRKNSLFLDSSSSSLIGPRKTWLVHFQIFSCVHKYIQLSCSHDAEAFIVPALTTILLLIHP